MAEALAGEFEVRSFVRRAYTGGPPERAPRTFAAEVDDLRAVLDAVGRPAHVVGALLGATLALHAARADPSGVRSLVLFEPPLLLAGPHVGEVAVRHHELVAAGEYRAAGLLVAREVLHAPPFLLDALAQAPDQEPEEAAREARGWEADRAGVLARGVARRHRDRARPLRGRRGGVRAPPLSSSGEGATCP